MTNKIALSITPEQLAKMKVARGAMLDKWIAKIGAAKVEAIMDDPDKLALINALAFLEATGK